ncbi:MAG: ATP-dependent DNA helicase RecG [Denitrobacterium detoxificans]|nr:ATP-dependent DNA helicase RecG [Denitrobacterium detoxificans]MBE6465373.1 ATP-dependent DNA helicase RecG [Denitrobacterium detoxificans]
MNSESLSSRRSQAAFSLDSPITVIKGISGVRAGALRSLGIESPRDLLAHYPRRYLDMSRVSTCADARISDSCTVVGTVYEVKVKRPKNLVLTEITINDGTGTFIVTCFRQPWWGSKLSRGSRIAVSGTVEFNFGFKRMTNPLIEVIEDPAQEVTGAIVPVHPASEKLPANTMRKLVSAALDMSVGLEDPLPLDLRTRYRLMSRASALRCIHFPRTMDESTAARRRLAYEEVLMLELHLMRSHVAQAARQQAMTHVVDGPCCTALRQAIPFELTSEQQDAVRDILGHMSRPCAMHHMLLGDVGTGKTAVAAFALAAVADSGTQALMMAPTEVLARQYARSLGAWFDAAGISWGVLTGSTDSDARAALLDRLASGELSVLFGTHALIEPEVQPKCCSLVVIDEQQRFGVAQRNALIEKGRAADVLSLTATPIPRSLALATYGDMTLSYLRSKPHEHAATATKVLSYSQIGEAYEAARNALDAGRQVYVVCPLVGQSHSQKDGAAAERRNDSTDSRSSQEGEQYVYASIAIEDVADFQNDDTRAAIEQARFLEQKIFCGYQVGVLHGRMKGPEKQAAMADFAEGRTQVLVATTVIEVGVDVPNATVMVIQDADRFGLAQLHQLRGRVGRGQAAGEVFLVSGSKAPLALERLSAMERISDGFELAEYDLSLRREGDILGNRQHGASTLKLVNVVRDAALIEAAHADARALLDADPDLTQPEHRALRYEVARAFPEQAQRKED